MAQKLMEKLQTLVAYTIISRAKSYQCLLTNQLLIIDGGETPLMKVREDVLDC